MKPLGRTQFVRKCTNCGQGLLGYPLIFERKEFCSADCLYKWHIKQEKEKKPDNGDTEKTRGAS